jgi:hypothetical protein
LCLACLGSPFLRLAALELIEPLLAFIQSLLSPQILDLLAALELT